MTHSHELRNWVVLLRRHIQEKEDGSFQETWTEEKGVWAKIIPLVAKEIPGEGWHTLSGTTGGPRYKVTLRYCQSRFSRVKWGAVTMAPLGAPWIDERSQWMVFVMYRVGGNEDE